MVIIINTVKKDNIKKKIIMMQNLLVLNVIIRVRLKGPNCKIGMRRQRRRLNWLLPRCKWHIVFWGVTWRILVVRCQPIGPIFWCSLENETSRLSRNVGYNYQSRLRNVPGEGRSRIQRWFTAAGSSLQLTRSEAGCCVSDSNLISILCSKPLILNVKFDYQQEALVSRPIRSIRK